MHRIFLLLLLSLLPVTASAGDSDLSPKAAPSGTKRLVRNEQAAADTPSINSLLAEMSENSDHTLQLLDKIASDGCSRQLQEDTIKLVSNMTRNIQIMTDIMVRMGYNIEQMSRAPKAMNSFPFMP
jgi:hypothetical protein